MQCKTIIQQQDKIKATEIGSSDAMPAMRNAIQERECTADATHKGGGRDRNAMREAGNTEMQYERDAMQNNNAKISEKIK